MTTIPLERIAQVVMVDTNDPYWMHATQARLARLIVAIAGKEINGEYGVETLSATSAVKTEIVLSDLARAIGMDASASEAEVLTALKEHVHAIAPGAEADRIAQERLSLVGLSADDLPRSEAAARVVVLSALIAATNGERKGLQRVAHVCDTEEQVKSLSNAQILAASVSIMAAKGSLVALRSSADGVVCLVGLKAPFSNGAKPGALPTRLKVLGWGVNRTLKGDMVVDEETAKVFAANQRAIGRERVALDFEHNTVPGSEEYQRSQEPRPVAGYWTPKVIPGEGIVLEAPKYVADEKLVLQYEDLSATPWVNDGRVIGLHSVALTRAGASDFMFLSAPELAGEIQTLSAACPRSSQSAPLHGFARVVAACNK